MSRPSLACALASGLLMTSGCTEEAPVDPPAAPQPAATAAASRVSYACESGGSVAVSYPDDSTARLTWRGGSHVLNRGPAETGSRYLGSGLEWQVTPEDGQEAAVLRRLGAGEAVGTAVLERCSRPSAAQGAEPSPETFDPAVAITAPPCRGDELSLSAAGGDAGAGNRVSVFALQNTGGRTCSLNGHAGVVLEDAEGRPLGGVRSEAVLGGYYTQGVQPGPVALKPRGRAFFDIAWSALPHEGEGERVCPKATRVRVTAPGDADPVTLDQAMQPCGGRIRVSPFRPAADSRPPASQART